MDSKDIMRDARYIARLRRLADLREGRKERAVAFQNRTRYNRGPKSKRVQEDD